MPIRGPMLARTARSRDLRVSSTKAELLVWRHLRNRQLEGLKFARQEPIGRYFVDFVCRERHLVVEIDGGQHAESAYDKKRDTEIAARGYHVIRFWNNEVLKNIEGVMQTLLTELRK